MRNTKENRTGSGAEGDRTLNLSIAKAGECGSFNSLGGGAGQAPLRQTPDDEENRDVRFNPLGGGAGAWDDPTLRQLRRRRNRFNPLGGGAGAS